MARPTTRLRAMLNAGDLVVAPFVWDGFGARAAQRAGCRAVYMTGFGTAAARGFPDVGLLTMSEMVQNAASIAAAVDLPVIADADTAYGNPINARRTVREYERAGVAAIHIEDQVWPKKCGFMAGKRVIPVEEMVPKIEAALDARTDPDFVIIARTDAYAPLGWEEAMRRCRLYREAGADLVFVDGIQTVAELRRYAADLPGIPKLYNGGLLPAAEVAALGFSVQIVGGTLAVIHDAYTRAFAELVTRGTITPALHGADFDFDALTTLLGLPEILELERRFAVADR
ncbi:MAG: isocitrate lyase/PEP mutase family protein [Dehalococcoidia bacterium]|nr:isocitrate lyase/PEP mutase family protein [Dehalococcoidia bacterium]